MSELIRLGDKTHCRFGDKGDTGLFILIPYDPLDFDTLVAQVTPARVSRHLGNLPAESVRCQPCRALGAMVVAVRSSLRGGVTSSLSIDAHGKTLSGYLLGMTIPWNEP
jgi:hypothetical protein